MDLVFNRNISLTILTCFLVVNTCRIILEHDYNGSDPKESWNINENIPIFLYSFTYSSTKCILPFILNETRYNRSLNTCSLLKVPWAPPVSILRCAYVCPQHSIKGQYDENGIPTYSFNDLKLPGYCPTNFAGMEAIGEYFQK